MLEEVRNLIQALGLKEHPEGGYYRETYRASGFIPQSALSAGFGGDRNISTAIYYLLPEGRHSRWHTIKSDEIWHFYSGGPLELFELTPANDCRRVTMGQDMAAGHVPQHVVPAGNVFAAAPLPGSRYSLVGCTVAPGFDFADFSPADPAELAARHPGRADLIKRFSP